MHMASVNIAKKKKCGELLGMADNISFLNLKKKKLYI